MLLSGLNFLHDSKVVFVEKAQGKRLSPRHNIPSFQFPKYLLQVSLRICLRLCSAVSPPFKIELGRARQLHVVCIKRTIFLTKVYLHLLKFPLPICLPQVKEWITRGACATSPSSTFPCSDFAEPLTFNPSAHFQPWLCTHLHPSRSATAPDACHWVTVKKAAAVSSRPDFSAMCFLAVWEGAVVKTSLIKFARWVGGRRGDGCWWSFPWLQPLSESKGQRAVTPLKSAETQRRSKWRWCVREFGTYEAGRLKPNPICHVIGQRFSLQIETKSPQIQLKLSSTLTIQSRPDSDSNTLHKILKCLYEQSNWIK